jgi:hypothetical protein
MPHQLHLHNNLHHEQQQRRTFATHHSGDILRVRPTDVLETQLQETKEMLARDPRNGSWRKVATHLANLRRLDLAFELLDELERLGMANQVIYLFFIKICSRVVYSSGEEHAREVIARMKARGVGAYACALVLSLSVRACVRA